MLMNEMSNRENAKCGGPSVVARLMGMDTFPPETGRTIHVKGCSSESSVHYVSRIARHESIKVLQSSLPLTSFKKSDDKLPLNWKQQYSRKSTKSLSSAKPFQREHPQEEQIQKFKKEFEAWQESKLCEFSSNFDQIYSCEGLKNEQVLALNTLNKEKLAGYTNISSVRKLKFIPNQLGSVQDDNCFGGQLIPQIKDDMDLRRELASKRLKPASRAKCHEESARYSPSRIVILKSFTDMNDEMGRPRDGSLTFLAKDNIKEDILEEVKKRLKLELGCKGSIDSVRRLSAAHTSSPLHAGLTDSEQLTWEIEKHIEEKITADLRETMGRSESMISHGNISHFDGQESPPVIKGETINFISDRLKNILKDDTELEKTIVDDRRGRNFQPTKENARSKSISSFSNVRNSSSIWDNENAWNESIKREPVDAKAPSYPDFVRSSSAPVSWSAFEKALSKDHHTTKDPNFQQHEASRNDSAVINKSKKDGFSIKGKISNLKRTLGLKGNFFGKKLSSVRESTLDTAYDMNLNQLVPSVVRNFSVVQDNSTEVPPSPVSFPCNLMSEHHSPVSPLEVPFVEDHLSTQVSGELNMVLPESKSPTEDVEGNGHAMETASELYDSNGDRGKAYDRDVVLHSGLYMARPFDQVISRLDKNDGRHARNSDDDYSLISLGDTIIDRKLLFDLVNEALPRVIEAPMSRLMSERWTLGRKFLDDLLNQFQIYADPMVDQPLSIESIVVSDVRSMSLHTPSREEISSLEREVERAIIEDLIGEFVFYLLV